MTGKAPRGADYVGHMLQAVANALAYTEELDEARLRESSVVRGAVIPNLEVIGEAARNVMRHAPEIMEACPQIPWGVIYVTHNRVSHGYFGVDLHVVWQVVSRELPRLQRALEELAESFSR